MVVNMAAGLDARPYRMAFPSSLTWVEVDLPDLLDYKEGILAGEKPACSVERARLDLSQSEARRTLFEQLNARARRIVVVAEGLLIYFPPDQVGLLADQLASFPNIQRWILDLCSPALMRMLQRQFSGPLSGSGAHFQFAPEQGPDDFRQHGWRPIAVRSLLHAAAKIRRLSLLMRLFALFPDTQGRKPNRLWGGVCLLARR